MRTGFVNESEAKNNYAVQFNFHVIRSSRDLPKEFEVVLVRDDRDRVLTAYWCNVVNEDGKTTDTVKTVWFIWSGNDIEVDKELHSNPTDWAEYKGVTA